MGSKQESSFEKKNHCGGKLKSKIGNKTNWQGRERLVVKRMKLLKSKHSLELVQTTSEFSSYLAAKQRGLGKKWDLN